MHDRIPVIDIGDTDRAATRRALDAACREWGFFHAVGHGLDPQLCRSLLEVARAFFAQPMATKRRVRRDAVNPWGYYDEELTKNRRDWKEIFDAGPPDDGSLAPRWPDGALGERLRETMAAYSAACQAVATRLLGAIVTGLGAAPDAVLRDFGPAHTSFLRLNHYPPQPRQAGGAASLGVGEHTDSGALTLLLQDEQPGLEVRRDGAWHGVAPLDGALVVNIGDIVQVWSNDRYRAAVHRAVTHAERDRYSAPFFVNPSYDACYAPLPTTVGALQPARYRPIAWREFRALRAAGDYADLGEEIQIHHYRAGEH